MAAPIKAPCIALRGSQGTWTIEGSPPFKRKDSFPKVTGNMCRCMAFSTDGTLLSFCDGASVRVIDLASGRVVSEIDKPRTSSMQFSPQNTVLATWEPYMVTRDQLAGAPNLHLWNTRTGELIKGFTQKKQQGWCPQWSRDEGICARNVNNEVHFYEDNKFDTIANKLYLQKVQDFSLPPRGGKPYHVAAYVPGAKGQPSFVRVFRYPNFAGPGSALANKSFYKADKHNMIWNNKGSFLLVLTATDTSAESYYGEQGLHFVGTDGESCLVPRAKNGPVYHVEWNPKSTEFCVVYGFMPAKATLFNLKCDPIFDFGTGPRNAVYFNPHGNMLVLAGFGNLHGNIEVWDLAAKKLVSNPKAPDCTHFEWCPDGQHVLTATTSPRLRVGNGYQVWHYTGTLMHDTKVGKDQELWQAVWQPAVEGQYPEPKISYKPVATTADAPAQPQAEAKAYVPPHLRNNPQAQAAKARAPKFREEYEKPSNQKDTAPEKMSKAALKNKKRREAKARKAAEGETPAATPAPASAPPRQEQISQAASAPASGLSEHDKKIRNLKKRLQQVRNLKEQQAVGKKLEIHQLEKIKSEAALVEELNQLTI